MANLAKEILVPNTGILRTIFLYTGQGESTLMIVPNGNDFKYVLIDINNDIENGGINVEKMLNDLLDEELDLFINTHPHNDHLKGIKKIHESIGIKQIWHSGHKPGKDHKEAYQELRNIINDIGSENEYFLFGTNDSNKIRESDGETEVIVKLGDIVYIVLAPAQYVAEDIEDEKPEERYKRIHEQCTVIKFSYGSETQSHILITGDSDKTAWKDYITDYHKDKLYADVLSAPHHGSRTFFKENEDDKDIYEKHIKKISPSHIVISAPKQSESTHSHPHDDAIELYKKHVNEDNIYHLGKNRECIIVDIDSKGKIEIKFNQELVKKYSYKPDNNNSNNGGKKESIFIASQTTRIDNKPMGHK